jgi:hypothetical protein
MAVFEVSIHWSDGEDTGSDEFLTFPEVQAFIAKELSYVGREVDYPEGVYPDEISILRRVAAV